MGKASKAFILIFILLFNLALTKSQAAESAIPQKESQQVGLDSVAQSAPLPSDLGTLPDQLSTTLPPVADEPTRIPPNFKLINDRPLILREYGFGALGSIVTGTLGFFIGSGIETALTSEEESHKGTLGFTGIRYDNNYGAFWGGTSGILLGSAFTTYFIGQTDEEEGGLLPTLLGTAVAATGALAIASWMGVNDEINWTPFIPLLAVPSLGGTLGFNLSRLYNDHKREKIIGQNSAIHLHLPSFSWSPTTGAGDRFMVHALNLSF